jgi:hypothetical protein
VETIMVPIASAAIDFARAYVPLGLLCLGTIFWCGIRPHWRSARQASLTPQSREANLSLALQLLSFCNILLLTLLFSVRSFLHGQHDRTGIILGWLIAPQLITAVSLIVVSVKLMRLRRLKAQMPHN